jgi:hypothetical protein
VKTRAAAFIAAAAFLLVAACKDEGPQVVFDLRVVGYGPEYGKDLFGQSMLIRTYVNQQDCETVAKNMERDLEQDTPRGRRGAVAWCMSQPADPHALKWDCGNYLCTSR